MSTAIAEPQTEKEAVTFISHSPNLVLTRRPSRYVDDGFGGKATLNEQEWRVREKERLEAVERQTGKPQGEPDDTPWKVEFQGNHYKPPADLSPEAHEKIVAWLRAHRIFNQRKGFYELGNAPDEPKPTMDQQMSAIAEAAASGDLDAARDVLQVERDTHNRPPILQAADVAVKRLEEIAAVGGVNADTSHKETPPSTPPL